MAVENSRKVTRRKDITMLGLIVVLLLAWLALSILGALIEGLFWLTIIGVVLFLATAAYGVIRQRTRRRVME